MLLRPVLPHLPGPASRIPPLRVRKPSAYPVLPMECVTVQEGGLVADPAAAQRVAPLVNLQDSFHDTVDVALGIHAARNGEPDEQQRVPGTDLPPACTPQAQLPGRPSSEEPPQDRHGKK